MLLRLDGFENKIFKTSQKNCLKFEATLFFRILQCLYELVIVLFIFEDPLTVDSPKNDMIDSRY